jgi:hypothetical protein
VREREDVVAERAQRRVQALRPFARREDPGDHRGDEHADQRAEDPVGEVPVGGLLSGRRRQREQHGGVAGQDDPVGARRAHEGARAGAERSPEREADHERHGVAEEEREEAEPDCGADERPHHPQDALVEK